MSRHCIWCGGKYFGKQNQEQAREQKRVSESRYSWLWNIIEEVSSGNARLRKENAALRRELNSTVESAFRTMTRNCHLRQELLERAQAHEEAVANGAPKYHRANVQSLRITLNDGRTGVFTGLPLFRASTLGANVYIAKAEFYEAEDVLLKLEE
jgi:ribosomal protein S20